MKYLSLISLALIGFNLIIWINIVSATFATGTDIYFLNVGQGDASLIRFEGGADILIDGGKDKSTLLELDKAMRGSRSIDLIMLSHPELDHFGGLVDVVKRFNVGAFIYNGQDRDSAAWIELKSKLSEKGIRIVIVDAGDSITYKANKIDIVSPEVNALHRKDFNENSVVALLESENVKILFTGDIGFKTERRLIDEYDLDIDILKVPHHGSKFSSSAEFLEELTPLVSVVQTGKNSYGHPNPFALERIASVGSSIYRNDLDGTVKLNINDRLIKVFK